MDPILLLVSAHVTEVPFKEGVSTNSRVDIPGGVSCMYVALNTPLVSLFPGLFKKAVKPIVFPEGNIQAIDEEVTLQLMIASVPLALNVLLTPSQSRPTTCPNVSINYNKCMCV